MLSENAKDAIRVAIANTDEAEELIQELEKIETAAAVAVIATVDATDLATVITLANVNKAKINELIAALG